MPLLCQITVIVVYFVPCHKPPAGNCCVELLCMSLFARLCLSYCLLLCLRVCLYFALVDLLISQGPRIVSTAMMCYATANICTSTNIMDFRGFDSSRSLIIRGGIIMSIGDLLESLSQAILVGIMLVGRLGV